MTWAVHGRTLPSGLEIAGSFRVAASQPALVSAADPAGNPGALDPSFDPGIGPNGPVHRVAMQEDGRMVIAGGFTEVSGSPRRGLARLNADGTVDASFDPRGGVQPGFITFLAVHSDGKILAGGFFTEYDGVTRPGAVRINSDGRIDLTFHPPPTIDGLVALYPDHKSLPRMPLVRLNADGSLDPNFVSPSTFPGAALNATFNGVASALVLDGGTVLVLADFTIYFPRSLPVPESRLFRLNLDGSLDNSFASHVLSFATSLMGFREDLAQQSNLGLLLLHGGIIQRYHWTGAIDSRFNPPAGDRPIQCLAVQEDGKIVMAGLFKTLGTVTRPGIGRLNQDGSIDAGFDPGAGLDSAESASAIFEFVNDIVVQSDGRILIAGSFLTIDGVRRPYIGRLLGGEPEGLPSIAVPPLSQTVMAEQRVELSVVAAGNPAPSYQWSFNDGLLPGATNAALILTNVTIAAAGAYQVEVSNSHGAVKSTPAILNVVPASPPTIVAQPQGGTLSEGADVSLSVTATNLLALAYQWRFNGAVIPGATNRTLVMRNVRLSNSGSYSVTVSSEVRTVTSDEAIVQVFPSRSVNPNFLLPRAPGDVDARSVTALAVQPDGRVLIIGGFTRLAGAPRNRIARLNTDGSLDPSFDPGDGVDGGYFTGSPLNVLYLDIQALALQPDGKILIGGRFTLVNKHPYRGIARLNMDGSVDTTFAGSGVTEGPSDPTMLFSSILAYVSSIVVQPDGKILIAGPFRKVNDVARNCIARLNTNGTLDPSFDPGMGLLPPAGAALLNATFHLALEPDGDVLVQGYFGRAFKEDIERSGIARFKANGMLDASFNPVITPVYWTTQRHSIAISDEGQIAITGSFTNVNSTARRQFARLHQDGTLDLQFAPEPIPDVPVAVVPQPDGRMIVYGRFTQFGGAERRGMARLNADGSVDPSLNPGRGPDGGSGGIQAVAVTPSGDIVVAGDFTTFDGTSRDSIALLYGADPLIPRLSPALLKQGGFQLTVQTIPGKLYQIESTESMVPPVWTKVQEFMGDGGRRSFEQQPNQRQQYFRARIQ